MTRGLAIALTPALTSAVLLALAGVGMAAAQQAVTIGKLLSVNP